MPCFIVVVTANSILPIFSPMLGDTSYYEESISKIAPFVYFTILAMMSLDRLKYWLTGDPRDEPGRKWFSIKYTTRFLPNEVVIMPGNHVVWASDAVSLQIAAMLPTECPKCGTTHAFNSDEASPRTCVLYGCGQCVANPKTS